MKALINTFLLTLALVGCDKPTEFNKLKELTKVVVDPNSNTSQIYEYVVITNPPANVDSLVILINNYSNTELNYIYLSDSSVIYYQLSFYKETDILNKNYKEDQSFFYHDDIGCYVDDIIAYVRKKSNDWILNVKVNNDYEGWDPDEWNIYPLSIAGQPPLPQEIIVW